MLPDNLNDWTPKMFEQVRKVTESDIIDIHNVLEETESVDEFLRRI